MSTLDLSTNPYDGSALGNLSDGLGVIEPLAPHDLRNAALTVAECARDAADAGLLLRMLGLIDCSLHRQDCLGIGEGA